MCIRDRITRLLKNKLYLSAYLLLLFIFTKSNQSFSHECILKDTTPKEITIYNSCLSQKNSQYNLDAKKFEEMEQKIIKLENENLLLKNKLLVFKKKIFDFLNNI